MSVPLYTIKTAANIEFTLTAKSDSVATITITPTGAPKHFIALKLFYQGESMLYLPMSPKHNSTNCSACYYQWPTRCKDR